MLLRGCKGRTLYIRAYICVNRRVGSLVGCLSLSSHGYGLLPKLLHNSPLSSREKETSRGRF